MNRRVLTHTARKLGLSFDEASSGLEAVAKMARTRYSIVSMDKQMPEMDGNVATETARAAGYTGVVVLVSGDTFVPCEQEALRRRGITAFLSKLATPSMRDALKRLSALKLKRA